MALSRFKLPMEPNDWKASQSSYKQRRDELGWQMFEVGLVLVVGDFPPPNHVWSQRCFFSDLAFFNLKFNFIFL